MYKFKFENLDIWKIACEYADEVQQVVKKFPPNEKFALIDQLNRSTSSIPDNIAEGSGAGTVNDFCHHLQISVKSTYESVSQLHRACRRGYITGKEKLYFYEEADIIVKKILALKKTVRKNGRF